MRDKDTVILERISRIQKEARSITPRHTKCFMNLLSFELLGTMPRNIKTSGTAWTVVRLKMRRRRTSWEIPRQLHHVGNKRENYLHSLGLNLFGCRIEALGNYNVDDFSRIQPRSTWVRMMKAIRARIVADVLPRTG
jgi:hypothetical protein